MRVDLTVSRSEARLARGLLALFCLGVTLLVPGRGQAAPLQPGIAVGKPCTGPPVLDLPVSRSVDAYLDATYELDLASAQGSLSKWLLLRYDDGTQLYLHVDDIGDEPLDGQGFIREAIDHAAVCAGGRIFPRRMNRTTTPRLWAARREVLRINDDYNSLFILSYAFPAVFTLVSTTAGAVGGPPPVATRRPVPGRTLRPRDRIPPQAEGTSQQAGTAGESKPIQAHPRTKFGGSAYDRAHRFGYTYREVYVDQPNGTRARLDGYTPEGGGEIVSRKFTQLADVQPATAFGYLRELATKFQPGYRISNVPSSGRLAGQLLRGRQILEVPVQTRPVPRAVLKLAKKLGVFIRDVAGRIYQ